MTKKVKCIIAAVAAVLLIGIAGVIALSVKHKNEMAAMTAELNMQRESELNLQKTIDAL